MFFSLCLSLSLSRIEKQLWKNSLPPIHARILGRFVYSVDWNLFRKLDNETCVCVCVCSLFLVLCNNACENHSFSWKFPSFFVILNIVDNFWDHYNAITVLRGSCVNGVVGLVKLKRFSKTNIRIIKWIRIRWVLYRLYLERDSEKMPKMPQINYFSLFLFLSSFFNAL